jgi:hypothetical protein
MLSALAMLLAVAARRVGVPDVFAAVSARARARRQERLRRQADEAAEAARSQAVAIEEQTRLRDAIVARRQRDAAATRDLAATPFGSGSLTPEPPPARPMPAPAAFTPPPPPAAGPAPPPAPTERPLTAAERLAAKRRNRR